MLTLEGCGGHSMQSILLDALLRIVCGAPNKPKTGTKPGTKKTKFTKTLSNKGIQGRLPTQRLTAVPDSGAPSATPVIARAIRGFSLSAPRAAREAATQGRDDRRHKGLATGYCIHIQ